MPPLRIAIVGAGVAGTAAAIALARSGHHVSLFEQSPAFAPVGAGLLLQPSGQAALARLGLLSEVTANAEPIETLHTRLANGRTLIHLRYDEHSPTTLAFGVHRSDLFRPLHTAALAAGVHFHLAHAITATEPGPRNQLHLLTSANIRIDHPPFDLVIAADGARSRLRHASNLRHYAHTYQHTALWALGTCSTVRGRLLQTTQGTRRLAGLLPTGSNRCSLFWGLTPSEHPHLLAAGFPAWRSQCLALCPEADEVFQTVTSFDHVVFAPFHHVHMPRWHNASNLVFIGDAAHAMSPHFGQGVNLALLDALALSDALSTSPSLPQSLHTFQSSRQSHTRLYSLLSLALTPFFQGKGHLKSLARNIALPTMTHIPPLRKRMVQTMTGLRPSISGL